MPEKPEKVDPKTGKPGKPAAPGTDPAKTGDAGGVFDPAKLEDEQLAKVLEDPRLWKTARLAELLETAKEFKAMKAKMDEAEAVKLEKQGKFKTLLEKTQGDLKAANDRLVELELSGKISQLASAKGITDVDAALKLIDKSGIKKGEDGIYTGITEAVDKLVTDKAYLVTTKPQVVGNPTNPGQPGNQPGSFTMTQIGDPKFYQENRDAILEAQRDGRIVEDRPGAMSTPAPAAGK